MPLVSLFSAVLLGLQLVVASPLTARAKGPVTHPFDDNKICHGGAWAGVNFVGETGEHGELSGSNPFCETRWPSGDIITGITTYSNGKTIRGLMFTYSGGDTKQYGGGFGAAPSGTITLGPGEIITSAWMAGDGVGTRLGKIHIETNKGQKVDFGSGTGKPSVLNVAGQILIGATGYCSSDIDALGLLFMQAKVTHIKVDDYKFDTDPTTNGPSLSTQNLDEVHYYNQDIPGNGTYNFQGTKALSNTNSFSQTTTGTFGTTATIELSAEVLGVGAKGTNGYTWSVSHSSETGTSKTEDAGLTWAQGGQLGPNKGVDCTAMTQHGEGNFPYTSTVTLNLADGSTFNYPEKGTLNAVQYSQVYIHCQAANQPSSPGLTTGPISKTS